MWCCKHAWNKNEKCRLAYCMKCKDVMLAVVKETTKRAGEEDKVLAKTILCYEKGECGRHTLGDLEDLVEMRVENGYLRSVRKNDKEKDWENMPETCWKCGDFSRS